MVEQVDFGNVRLSYLGHSGFIMQTGKHHIVVDPFLTNAPMRAKSRKTLRQPTFCLRTGMPTILAMPLTSAKTIMLKLLPFGNWHNGVRIRAPKQFRCLSALPNVMTGAKQFFGRPFTAGCFRTGKALARRPGIIFDFGDLKIYHLGDTAINPDIKFVGEFYRPDVALIPIGGRVNLDICQAVDAAQWLGVKTVIPTHYDLFTQGLVDPYDFQREIELKTKIECIVMEPKPSERKVSAL